MMGLKVNIPDIKCANTYAIFSVDQYLIKQGTITNHEDAHCIKSIKYSVSPVVPVAVDVKNASDLPKLVKRLRKLEADPLVVCFTEESGEHIIARCREIHVKIRIKDLEEDYAKCPLKKETQLTHKKRLSLRIALSSASPNLLTITTESL